MKQLKDRMDRLDRERSRKTSDWLQGLSDEELRAIAGQVDLRVSGWLRSLTDDELKRVRDGGRI